MSEIYRQILITLRGMWRYRWLGLATTWIVGVIAVCAVLILHKEKYEASTRIYVNTESILKPLLTGVTVQPNLDQRIEMLSRMVISRPNVEKLIRTVGLDAQASSREDTEKLVEAMIKLLSIKGAGRENLYTLSYRDPKPELAKRVIEVFSSLFIESGQGGRIGDTDAARKFIDDQVAVYEKKLQEAENRLKEFRLRYLGMAVSDGKDYFTRLTEARELLSRAQLELREAENARDAYRLELSRLAREEPAAPVSIPVPSGQPAPILELNARIESMNRALDGLLLKYTDRHPDVVGARRVLADLEEQKQKLMASRKTEEAPLPVPQAAAGGTRAFELLKVSLAQAEANAASMRSRVAEYTSRVTRLTEAARLMPQVEAEYAQLNRDYNINKKNYEILVARRESAAISSDMQSVSGVADFRVVDPPRVSPRPVFPNRTVYLLMAFVAAVGAGFAVAFVVTEMRLTFFDARALREATGLPILGTVSMIITDVQRRETRKSAVRFAGGAGAFVAAYVAGLIAWSLVSVRVV